METVTITINENGEHSSGNRKVQMTLQGKIAPERLSAISQLCEIT